MGRIPTRSAQTKLGGKKIDMTEMWIDRLPKNFPLLCEEARKRRVVELKSRLAELQTHDWLQFLMSGLDMRVGSPGWEEYGLFLAKAMGVETPTRVAVSSSQNVDFPWFVHVVGGVQEKTLPLHPGLCSTEELIRCLRGEEPVEVPEEEQGKEHMYTPLAHVSLYRIHELKETQPRMLSLEQAVQYMRGILHSPVAMEQKEPEEED